LLHDSVIRIIIILRYLMAETDKLVKYYLRKEKNILEIFVAKISISVYPS
jgi:hypothetical protein